MGVLLVPPDHFYRQLDRTLDLAFVREFVRPFYAAGGRPSIDPVVFFKLQLVMFFEGIRSERQLLRTAADRLSVRWYLGYDLHEELPDHSSLTRIRDRYGVDTFRRFFEHVVEQCQEAGLVWGKELYFDGTQVEANADDDQMLPRFYLQAKQATQAHLAALFPHQPEQEPQVEQTTTVTISPGNHIYLNKAEVSIDDLKGLHLTGRLASGRRLGDRQDNGHGGAAADCAFHRDRAAMLLHDGIGAGKTKTGSARFRSEIRIEDSWKYLGRYALSKIPDGDADILGTPDRGVLNVDV